MFLELSRYLNIENDREEENDRESESEATRIHLLLFFFFSKGCLFVLDYLSVL